MSSLVAVEPRAVRLARRLVEVTAAAEFEEATKRQLLDQIAAMRVALGVSPVPSLEDVLEESNVVPLAVVFLLTFGVVFAWHVLNVWVHYRGTARCTGVSGFLGCVTEFDRSCRAVLSTFALFVPIYLMFSLQLKRRRAIRRARQVRSHRD